MTVSKGTFTVRQGDSLNLEYALDGVTDLTGWTCRVQVRASYTGSALLDINLTELRSGNSVIGGLMQTAALNPGEYILAAELANGSTGESREIHAELKVYPQAVFDDA